MTNEQLATFIKQGDNEELKPILWERVNRLLYMLAGLYYKRYEGRFIACGVQLADLRQECYGAFLKALEGYKPANEILFTSYLKYPLKSTVNSLLGIRNKNLENLKPLDNCISLDKTIELDEGSCTIGDLVPDTTAQEAYEQALKDIDDNHTRLVLKAALDKLESSLRDVIVWVFFDGSRSA